MIASPTWRTRFAACLVGPILLLGGWWLWAERPPQLGADAEVFRTVDALFTALTARDERLLGDCAERLRMAQESGKLPADATAYLDRVIDTARQGRWQPAAETLYGFMKAQRREETQ